MVQISWRGMIAGQYRFFATSFQLLAWRLQYFFIFSLLKRPHRPICSNQRWLQLFGKFYFIGHVIENFSENYLSVSKWFKRPGFYRTCALYTLTRMIYNLTQCYIPVYVSESMNYPTKYVGYVPLVLYLAGCLYSAVVTPMVNLVGKKVKLVVILSLTVYSPFTLLLDC